MKPNGSTNGHNHHELLDFAEKGEQLTSKIFEACGIPRGVQTADVEIVISAHIATALKMQAAQTQHAEARWWIEYCKRVAKKPEAVHEAVDRLVEIDANCKELGILKTREVE